MSLVNVTSPQQKQTASESWNSSEGIAMQRFFLDHIRKGIQAGSIIGMCLVLPYGLFKDLKNLRVISAKRILRKQAASLTLGVGLSLLWMGIRYLSWDNRQQKVIEATYYKESDLVEDINDMTLMWGGGSVVMGSIITRNLILAMGLSSPVIAAGILFTCLDHRNNSESSPVQ